MSRLINSGPLEDIIRTIKYWECVCGGGDGLVGSKEINYSLCVCSHYRIVEKLW